jgi:hypothetical protein
MHEHRLVELCFCQKPFEPTVLLHRVSEPLGLVCLHAAIQLTPAVVDRMGDLEKSAGACNGLALGKQLVSRYELADDLLGRVTSSFYG